MNILEIWINCPDRETACGIAAALIDGRLAACANILPEIESMYRWKGKFENEPEVPLVIKTREGLFGQVVDKVRGLHPYETPSIVGIPVGRVNHDYLEWVYAETGKDPG